MMHKIKIFMEMIKFEHTVFALPFAYLGYVLGSDGRISMAGLFWVTAAMVAARTAGMSFNRLIDREIDARNPRTSGRALVTGELRPGFAWAIGTACLAVLIFAASRLNTLCLLLSPFAVVLLVAYNYLKRFSYLCHFGIGLVLACAPIGGWAAAAGRIGPEAVLLGLAVLTWVAGFDIFYSLQDTEFDRKEGLHSIPARFGTEKAVWVSRVLHLGTLLFLILLGIMMRISYIYWVGLAFAGAILAVEHALIGQGRTRHIGLAFFTLNGVLSMVFFVFAAAGIYLR